MICRDHVDRAIYQSPDHCLTILFLSQRRIHLRQSAVFDHCIFGQGKMMGGGFRMNVGTSLFRLPHQFYRFLTADMLDIDAGTGLLRQLQIPFH